MRNKFIAASTAIVASAITAVALSVASQSVFGSVSTLSAPKDPPITVHDGSLSVDFKVAPTVNNGIYSATTANIRAFSIAPEYAFQPSGSVDETVCTDGSACPGLEGDWEIDVCDLHDQVPVNGHACSHGIAVCSSMKSDHSCNVGGIFPSSSTTVSVVSIAASDTLVLDSSATGVTRYKNIDSDDADLKKCQDLEHQCDFPGSLYVTHRGVWNMRTDKYQCQTTAKSSNGDPVCKVAITDLIAAPGFWTRLQTKLRTVF